MEVYPEYLGFTLVLLPGFTRMPEVSYQEGLCWVMGFCTDTWSLWLLFGMGALHRGLSGNCRVCNLCTQFLTEGAWHGKNVGGTHSCL